MKNLKGYELNNIQVLRAFAALAVVFHHAHGRSLSYGIDSSQLSVFGLVGQAGVDLFFVISGFILIYAYQKRKKSGVRFLCDRFLRIAPLYYLITVSLCLTFFLVPDVFRNFSFSIEHFVQSLMFSSQLLSSNQPVLGVGWTLEFEAFFYLVFAGGIFLRRFISVEVSITLIVVFLVIIGVAPSICLEFIFGVLVAVGARKNWINFNSVVCVALFCVGLLLYFFGAEMESKRVYFFGVGSSLILLASLAAKPVKNKTIILLGEASFSIYLVHDLSLSLLIKVSVKLLNPFFLIYMPVVFAVLSVLIGIFLYMLVEQPMSKMIKKNFSAGR